MAKAGREDGVRYWALYWLAWAVMAAPLLVDGLALAGHSEAAHQQANVDLGRWATRFLILSLAVRPAAQLLRMPALMRYRRMIALFGFAYTLLHGLDYILYAHAWIFPWRVWSRRLYLLVGVVVVLVMIPLAITSFDGLRRAMGPRAWGRLHGLVYLASVLTIVHMLWEGRIDYTQSWISTALLAVLLLVRLPGVIPALVKTQSAREARVEGNTSRLAS